MAPFNVQFKCFARWALLLDDLKVWWKLELQKKNLSNALSTNIPTTAHELNFWINWNIQSGLHSEHFSTELNRRFRISNRICFLSCFFCFLQKCYLFLKIRSKWIFVLFFSFSVLVQFPFVFVGNEKTQNIYV